LTVAEPRIVVVDDEPDVLRLVCDVLEGEGVIVEAAARPDKIPDLSESPPDLMLLDLMLPGMNGIDLAHKLRTSGLNEVPMVAMSASESMLRRAAMSHLFEEVLAKPFDIADLLTLVRRHVSFADIVA
jgi:CheY-like chemotaxis protein